MIHPHPLRHPQDENRGLSEREALEGRARYQTKREAQILGSLNTPEPPRETQVNSALQALRAHVEDTDAAAEALLRRLEASILNPRDPNEGLQTPKPLSPENKLDTGKAPMAEQVEEIARRALLTGDLLRSIGRRLEV